MQNITVHYCAIDYDQQFAAIDQVCCRKMSFFKKGSAPPCDGPVKTVEKSEVMG